MPSRRPSLPLWVLLSWLAPLSLGSTSEAAPVDTVERRAELIEDAQQHIDKLDKLAGQVKNPALSEPMDRSIRNLRATFEELSALGNGGQVSLPRQADPVAFSPPAVEVQVGLESPGGVPIVVAVEVPIDSNADSEPVATMSVSKADLNSLLDAMSEEGFADRRLALLRSACSEAYVTVDQALSIIDAFEFGTDKVEAAAFLNERVSDPQNFHRVYGALDFDTDKAALRARVE